MKVRVSSVMTYNIKSKNILSLSFVLYYYILLLFIGKGLMKCSLQEFQHMFPQLTSCIKKQNLNGNFNNNNTPSLYNPAQLVNEQHELHFMPMECPILPLDTNFQCKSMLHEEFDVVRGPLWRVQLVDESSMDLANLGFGPELSALLEDNTVEQSTRWRYFLRYQQGSVNQVMPIILSPK